MFQHQRRDVEVSEGSHVGRPIFSIWKDSNRFHCFFLVGDVSSLQSAHYYTVAV